MTADLLFLPLGVAAGAVTQRVTGVGFALVAAPLLVLATGAFDGIILANVLSLLVGVVVLARTWRDVEWRRGILLAVPALAVVPLGAFVARSVPAPVLLVVTGTIVLLALGLVQLGPRTAVLHGTTGAVGAGAASGFMNVTAGVGGPAMVLYAVSTRWEHHRFVATFQFYAVLVNLASLATKGPPHLPPSALAVSVGALGVGLLLGELLSRRVPADRASRAVVVLAMAGALATVVKGVVAL
ncbi:TSUP family transporter [Phycicoccus sp. Soil748]|uniref:TSUP family transporter n=1 Tax=Phycicoccus sp. Soil748 TaxID=1736397 RepID=UPI0007024A67|nr:TSUP family transporter [Phycicoccus sp. Soil748]KRE52516.1 hypothetical protein ASG70_14020 [Phycicoccus sp. Soil748]